MLIALLSHSFKIKKFGGKRIKWEFVQLTHKFKPVLLASALWCQGQDPADHISAWLAIFLSDIAIMQSVGESAWLVDDEKACASCCLSLCFLSSSCSYASAPSQLWCLLMAAIWIVHTFFQHLWNQPHSISQRYQHHPTCVFLLGLATNPMEFLLQFQILQVEKCVSSPEVWFLGLGGVL